MQSGWLGEPDYKTVSVGPDVQKRIVSGLYLISRAGNPLVALLRQANPQYGRNSATLEVMGANPAAVDDFLKHLKTGLRENSIFRGHVTSFTLSEYSSSAAGITFHHRIPVAKRTWSCPTEPLNVSPPRCSASGSTAKNSSHTQRT